MCASHLYCSMTLQHKLVQQLALATLWGFSLGRQDSTWAIQGHHLLIKWIINSIMISFKNFTQSTTKDSGHQSLDGSTKSKTWYWLLFSNHSIWSKCDLFPIKLTHFSPKGTEAHSQPQENKSARVLFSAGTSVLVWRGGTCPKVRGQKYWALLLLLTWVSSVGREKGHKGLRDYQKVCSCIMQRLLSNAALGTDLLPSSFPIGKHRIYDKWPDVINSSYHQQTPSKQLLPSL